MRPHEEQNPGRLARLRGGPLGLHRFYLHGLTDMLGWLLPIPTALGLYGIQRVQQFGQDDQYSWFLIPLLGFTIAGCALRGFCTACKPRSVGTRATTPAPPNRRLRAKRGG